MGALSKSDIHFSIIGNDQSAKAINNFKKNVKGTGAALSGLRNAIMAAFSTREIIEAANVMIGVENRMNALTGSAEKTAIAMNHMRTIASDSRSDFDAVAMLYTRLSLATDHLGATQRDVADATQTVANTFIIAGSHAQEANNSARQLAQGLASGALRGDELRSVMENNTILTKMLADGLNMTIGELREFGHAGKLTAETVMPILIKGTKETNEQINKMPMTLGQAAVALRLCQRQAAPPRVATRRRYVHERGVCRRAHAALRLPRGRLHPPAARAGRGRGGRGGRQCSALARPDLRGVVG